MENLQYIGYVYKTTNLINNKIYVGKRQKSIFDIYYIGSGKKLKSAVQHYGKENFRCDVLQWCSSLAELNAAEKYWINTLKSREPEIGYNISFGGDGGDVFHSLPDNKQAEIRKKCKMSGCGTLGKFRVYKQIDDRTVDVKFISPEELNFYIQSGWKHGLEPELAKKQGEIRAGRKQSAEWKEKRFSALRDRSAEEKEITRLKHSEATKLQMANLSAEEKSLLGKKARQASIAKLNGQKAIWIHKEKIRKLVAENTVEEWLSNGWKRGFKLDE